MVLQILHITDREKFYRSYIDGKLHRTDGPAMIWYYESGQTECEFFYINDEYFYIDRKNCAAQEIR